MRARYNFDYSKAVRGKYYDRLAGLATRGSGNIFVDLGCEPGEAASLKLRSTLMMCIEKHYRESGVSRAAAAKKLGLTRSDLDALLDGHLSQFNLDALVGIATRAGLRIRMVVTKATKQ